MEKLPSLGIHFPERYGVEFRNLFLPGVGAEVQVEKGAGQGQGDGVQAGWAQYSTFGDADKETQDHLGVCWRSMDASAVEDNLDFQPLVTFLHFYGECYA